MQPQFTLTPKVAETQITWTSSDPAVVTVNETTGEITAVGVGKATVTATTANGKTAKKKITVKASKNNAKEEIVESLVVEEEEN